jgi:predicted unusual protein kinase regulating ubiquinone biosynthesis (AarF/ABC1/UbiB family)
VLVTEFIEGTKVDRLESLFEQQSISFEQLMERLTEVYIRMMLIDGTLHADPHPGNILVDSAGTIIFLDFGMVVQIQRSTRERVFRMALAAAREDVDGIINGMFELGMIDPEISRSEIRAAALEIITILQGARGAEPRRIQEMVQEILDTFYTWPLILPEELVYFFRAAALLEGIGFRYDPHFLGMDAIKPVVQRMRGELLEATTREPRAIVHDLLEEARQGIRAVQDLVRRAEREELRLRAHPRDVLHAERVAGLLVRRLLLGLFASVMAIVSTLMFVATRSWIVLAIGNGVAIFLFLVVLVVPKHLLEYPLRDSHGRARRRPAGV